MRTEGRMLVQRGVAIAAAAFGILTIAAGSRVLTGLSDPGYAVFRPLLVYNTAMGGAYLAAGAATWRSLRWGEYAAGVIFVLNLVVLGGVVVLYATGGAVAAESVGAMSFRAAVWGALFVILAWRSRRAGPGGSAAAGASTTT